MKLDDSQSSAEFLKSVAALAGRLTKSRVAIYEHSFDYMAFGSWEIVAGRRKKMLRFTYDGRDSYLSFCDATTTPQSHTDLQHRIRIQSDQNTEEFDLVPPSGKQITEMAKEALKRANQ